MRERTSAFALKTAALLVLASLALGLACVPARANNFQITDTECDRYFTLPPLALDKLGLIGLSHVHVLHPELNSGGIKIPGFTYEAAIADNNAPKIPVLITTVPDKAGEHGSSPELKVISIGHKAPAKEASEVLTSTTGPAVESSPVYVVEIAKPTAAAGTGSVIATGQKSGDSANGTLMVKNVAEVSAAVEVGGNYFKSNLAGGVQIVRVPIGSSVSLVASSHTTFRVFASEYDSKGSIAPGAEVKIEVPTSSGQALRFGLRGGPDVIMAPRTGPQLSGAVHAGVEIVFF